MKILLNGDSRNDHFFALISVAEELIKIIDETSVANAQIHLFSSNSKDAQNLFEKNIYFTKVPKITGPENFGFFDYLKNLVSFIVSFIKVFNVFPDVILAKGGDSSRGVLQAAKLLKIPVILHESNSIPHPVSKWASGFAYATTISYKQASVHFKNKANIIHTGQPIRDVLEHPNKSSAYDFLDLEKNVPIVWILSGESEAKNINYELESVLPSLLKDFQVIHQTGKTEYSNMKKLVDALLDEHPFKYRYHAYPVHQELEMKMISAVAHIAIARASSILFEIAHWEIPLIVIPEGGKEQEYQIRNAYNYAREGACVVIEENNLSPKLFEFEIRRILSDENLRQEMKKGADIFSHDSADKKIAEEIVKIAISHEK